jgi:Tachylectin
VHRPDREPGTGAGLRARLIAIVAAAGLVGAGLSAALVGSDTPAVAAVVSSCGPVLPLYGVAADGSLQEWLDHEPAAPVGVTAQSTAVTPVSTAWGTFTKVLPAGQGVIYTVSADGALRWWRQQSPGTGSNSWTAGSGVQVGRGWAGFTELVSVGQGVLYGVTPDGRLLWYRHLGYSTGAVSWAVGSGTQVGNGWGAFRQIVPGGLGALYGLQTNGHLLWYSNAGWLAGKAAWSRSSGSLVGWGWSTFSSIVSGSGGILFGVKTDGGLAWYDHLGAVDGTTRWALGSGTTVPGVNVAGMQDVVADPTVCTGLDRDDVAAVRTVAAGMLAVRGWDGTQFTCFSNIASRESSWRWNAGSPSGAYGIPQAVPGVKMGADGSDWLTNPLTQVSWMMDYVGAKYGTPCAAWAFWSAHGFY